jgi:hypothetical protein
VNAGKIVAHTINGQRWEPSRLDQDKATKINRLPAVFGKLPAGFGAVLAGLRALAAGLNTRRGLGPLPQAIRPKVGILPLGMRQGLPMTPFSAPARSAGKSAPSSNQAISNRFMDEYFSVALATFHHKTHLMIFNRHFKVVNVGGSILRHYKFNRHPRCFGQYHDIKSIQILHW